MTRTSLLWRLVVGAERYLPRQAPLLPRNLLAGEPYGAAKRSVGQRLAFSSVLVMPAAMAVSRHHWRDIAEAWPVWRPAILDILLLVAAVTVVAGAASGLMAWRRADHA